MNPRSRCMLDSWENLSESAAPNVAGDPGKTLNRSQVSSTVFELYCAFLISRVGLSLVRNHLELNVLTWYHFISVVKERFENIFDLEEEEDTRTGRVQVIQTSITSSCSSSKSIVKYEDEHQENDTLGAQADKLEQLRKKVTTHVSISCQAIQTSDHWLVVLRPTVWDV